MLFLLVEAIKENLLASRLERFKAAAIDNLIIYVPAVILVSVFPKKEDIPSIAAAALGLGAAARKHRGIWLRQSFRPDGAGLCNG